LFASTTKLPRMSVDVHGGGVAGGIDHEPRKAQATQK
jgi:hypothetical protein